jgi:hypothetical protein
MKPARRKNDSVASVSNALFAFLFLGSCIGGKNTERRPISDEIRGRELSRFDQCRSNGLHHLVKLVVSWRVAKLVVVSVPVAAIPIRGRFLIAIVEPYAGVRLHAVKKGAVYHETL